MLNIVQLRVLVFRVVRKTFKDNSISYRLEIFPLN